MAEGLNECSRNYYSAYTPIPGLTNIQKPIKGLLCYDIPPMRYGLN